MELGGDKVFEYRGGHGGGSKKVGREEKEFIAFLGHVSAELGSRDCEDHGAWLRSGSWIIAAGLSVGRPVAGFCFPGCGGRVMAIGGGPAMAIVGRQ